MASVFAREPMTAAFRPIGFDRARLVAELERNRLDAVLLASPENVFYCTGYTTLPSAGNPILYMLRNRLPAFAYADRGGHLTLLCWGFSADGVEFGADEVIGFNDFGGAVDALQSMLASRIGNGRRTLAVESTCPYFAFKVAERSARNIAATGDDVMTALRRIKTAAEIERLRTSTDVIERTVEELYGILEPGMSRVRLMDEARLRMIANGATGISHITFSFAGENPEFAIDEPLDSGRLVTLDLGAVVDGYCSDNRRYAYGGAVPESLQTRYEAMVAMVDAVGAALIPGHSYKDVFEYTLGLYAERDIEPLGRFNHTGHNIGIETEEEWLDDDPDKVIEPGMVINIELYSRAETGEQIGNEETYVIQPDGPLRISSLPREIRSV